MAHKDDELKKDEELEEKELKEEKVENVSGGRGCRHYGGAGIGGSCSLPRLY